MRFATAIFAALAISGLNASPIVRLVYGEGWSEAGRRVKTIMESDEFRSLSAGRYKIEFANEEGKTELKRMASLKLPFALLLNEKGELIAVADSLKASDTPENLLAKFDKSIDEANAKREKNKSLASNPAWQRHLAMPFVDHSGKERTCQNADGLEIIEEATWYRQNNRLADGEAFIVEQKAMPDEYLDALQRQSLLLAEVALYLKEDFTVPDKSKRKTVVDLLKDARKMERTSLWGVAANGLLEKLGER